MFNITENLTNITYLKNSVKKNKNVLLTSEKTASLLVLSYLFKETERTFLIVCENNEEGEKIYDTLPNFGIEEEKILYFPKAEYFPGGKAKPDYGIIGERLFTLKELLKADAKIIVAPIDALCGKIIDRDTFQKNIISLKMGDDLEWDEFEKKLIKIGYKKSEVCDRKGLYSKRGSLIDIYPSNLENPIRINADWDNVEEIKYFDTDTQRSTDKTETVEILPAREVLFDNKNQVIAKMKEAFEKELKTDNENIDKIKTNTQTAIEKIGENIFFDGLEFYLPYFYENSFLWDYLPENSVICFSNPQGIEKELGYYKEILLSQRNENRRKGFLSEKLSAYAEKEFLYLLGNNFTTVGLCEIEPAVGFFSNNDLSVKSYELNKLSLPKFSKVIDTKNPFSFTKININSTETDTYVNRFNELINYLNNLPKNEKVIFATASATRMAQILQEYNISCVILNQDTDIMALTYQVCVAHAPFLGGVYFPGIKVRILTDKEVFGIKRGKKVRRLLNDTKAVKSYLDLKKGDFVVHEDYGVCCYKGIEQKEVLGSKSDFLILQFEIQILYVSTNGLEKVQKYVGGDGLPPKLSKIGSKEWEKIKTRAKKKIWAIAKELVELYAYRQKIKGYQYEKDTDWQIQLEESFPYKETKSQLNTINEIKKDMESDRPMDRLVCGDVGYGKTEVAIRAAFKVAIEGRQVAVLAPTTVLSQQHFTSFKERLAPFPTRIELLNRFKSSKEIKVSLENIKTGTADIVIGTHRVLSKDVEFSNLGLLIIDEEQRFGVKHKEKLKELKKNVDVLSLSATPIPRTLNMSLSGIREISLITDAPEGRIPIKTFVKPYDKNLIREAIKEELSRGGQVFFIHNRVEDIYRVAEQIENLVPQANIDVAHGQMPEKELEECMMDFYSGKINVLVSTTIIENGIDVANANTIIIDNADKLGLSQLYQLRGRVGRSGRQAFAYLLYRGEVTVEGEERLKALEEFSDLGSGFRIAERDLEIRGAGNLLGKEQSGNVEGIGFEYYCRLLDEAVKEFKGEKTETVELPPVDLASDTYIPQEYIEVESLRIMFYKKLSQVKNKETLDNIKSEIEDRFGPLPKETENMFKVLNIRLLCMENKVASIGRFNEKYSIVFNKDINFSSDVIKKINKAYPNYTMTVNRLFYYVQDVLEDTEKVLRDLPSIFTLARNAIKRYR